MAPIVGVVMGSKSDWETMQHCVSTLEALGIQTEVRVMSAHRTPDVAIEFSKTAEELFPTSRNAFFIFFCSNSLESCRMTALFGSDFDIL